MPISSWIGFEVALIEEQFTELGIDKDAYKAFLSSIPYRFYPIVMVLFGFLSIALWRDYSYMYYAECRSRKSEFGYLPREDEDDERGFANEEEEEGEDDISSYNSSRWWPCLAKKKEKEKMKKKKAAAEINGDGKMEEAEDELGLGNPAAITRGSVNLEDVVTPYPQVPPSPFHPNSAHDYRLSEQEAENKKADEEEVKLKKEQERRKRTEEGDGDFGMAGTKPKQGIPHRWYNAVVSNLSKKLAIC